MLHLRIAVGLAAALLAIPTGLSEVNMARAADSAAVHPGIRVAPSYRAPAKSVEVAGWGFRPGETVTVRLGGVVVDSDTATARGRFRAGFYVPGDQRSGTYPVIASQASGATARDELTVRINWSHPGYNTKNSKYNDMETHLGPAEAANLDLLWSAPAAADYPILVDDGSIINGPNVLDAGTGALRWTDNVDGAVSGAAASNGKVYVTDSAHGVSVFDVETGQRLATWQAVPGRPPSYESPPTIQFHTLYLIDKTDSTRLYAVDLDTLTTKWSVQLDPTAMMTNAPVVTGYSTVITAGRQLFVYYNNAGELLWSATLPENNSANAAPAVGPDGTVYIAGSAPTSGGHAVLAAYKGHTGTLKWFRSLGDAGGSVASPAIANGVLYTTAQDSADSTASLFALSASDGNPMWSRPLASGGASGAAVADGVVYTTNRTGLEAYDISGNLLAGYSLHPNGYKAITNGVVYAMSSDRGIYAYAPAAAAVRSTKLPGPAPSR